MVSATPISKQWSGGQAGLWWLSTVPSANRAGESGLNNARHARLLAAHTYIGKDSAWATGFHRAAPRNPQVLMTSICRATFGSCPLVCWRNVGVMCVGTWKA